MIARAQYKIGAADLDTILGLLRAGSLAAAAERLGQDASTVFRNLQRIEKGLGQQLFERSRAGYRATDLALELGLHAERVEAELEAARSATQFDPGKVSGTVKITTTDTVLHGLVGPALKSLHALHPLLDFELVTANELASLTRRGVHRRISWASASARSGLPSSRLAGEDSRPSIMRRSPGSTGLPRTTPCPSIPVSCGARSTSLRCRLATA